MSSGELLPCPFCGGEASDAGTIRYHPGHEAWWADGTRITRSFYVDCKSCGASRKGMFGQQTHDLAIAAWNTRTPAARQSRQGNDGGGADA